VCLLQYRVEYRREIAGRRIDDLQHLGGRGLLSERLDSCHRPDFSGRESVPRLADQRQDYLLKTLSEYKSGARRAYEPIMVEVLQPISEAAMVELSYYLAHLR
jgi:hypothetical protein